MSGRSDCAWVDGFLRELGLFLSDKGLTEASEKIEEARRACAAGVQDAPPPPATVLPFRARG